MKPETLYENLNSVDEQLLERSETAKSPAAVPGGWAPWRQPWWQWWLWGGFLAQRQPLGVAGPCH